MPRQVRLSALLDFIPVVGTVGHEIQKYLELAEKLNSIEDLLQLQDDLPSSYPYEILQQEKDNLKVQMVEIRIKKLA